MAQKRHSNKRPALAAHSGTGSPPNINNRASSKLVIYLAVEIDETDLVEAWETILDGATGYGAVVGAEIWEGEEGD